MIPSIRSKSSKNFKLYSKIANNPLNASNSKLSLHTLKINESSLIEFQKVQILSNKQSIEGKLETIKNALNKTYTKVKFDTILNNLDVITNEMKFIKSRLELAENIPIKGYMEKKAAQFFELIIKGQPSPLEINIEISKGEVDAYFSFTTSNPNMLFRDICSRKLKYNCFLLFY